MYQIYSKMSNHSSKLFVSID